MKRIVRGNRIIHRLLAMGLCAALVLGSAGMNVFASSADEEPAEITVENDESFPGEESEGQESFALFEQSFLVNDTGITVSAEGGVFPEGEPPVLESLQDEWLMQQAEDAAVPEGNESRMPINHALYSLTGTSMNGTVHVRIENCGLAGLSAEYPDA